MFDRAKVIDENFRKSLKKELSEKLNIQGNQSLGSSRLKSHELVDILETQMTSRLLDIKSRELRKIGKSFYTISSSGHEAMAAVGLVSKLDDMAFLHYRDSNLVIQRSKKKYGHTIINDILTSFGACADDPISGGRHKVLGHKDLFIPPQTSTIASHLPKAVGAALSIPRAKDLKVPSYMSDDSVVLCTFGDASMNHASAQTAINCANWLAYQNIPLPLVFICEDNGIGISVPTPEDWVHNTQSGNAAIKYFECDGRNILSTFETTTRAFQFARKNRKPVFLRIKTVRLLGHAGSDIETLYRSQDKIEASEAQDPLLVTAELCRRNKVLTGTEILSMYDQIKMRIDRVAKDVILKPLLKTAEEVLESVTPTKVINKMPLIPSDEYRAKVFGREWKQIQDLKMPLGRLLNINMTDTLTRFNNALVFGEDIAKKGGVYHITAKLEDRFGRKRVFNSLLDETSILGTAIGLAHNGFLPIPEIQFLAYVHNAQDQIRGEAATLSFFSNQQYTNGMVIRVAGLGYQKGFGGHFHNDNSLTIFRDLPGVIIACPSNGADAVKMMRGCLEEAHVYGKVCIFVEPIALYPIKDLHEEGDEGWSFKYPVDLNEKIMPGEFAVDGDSKELCIVSYANGFYLSKQAQKILFDKYKIKTKLIDLRWVTGWDEKNLSSEIEKSDHVLIVDECRKSGSMSEALLAMLFENCKAIPKVKRLCGHDTYIPLGDAANLVMPSKENIVASALELVRRKQ